MVSALLTIPSSVLEELVIFLDGTNASCHDAIQALASMNNFTEHPKLKKVIFVTAENINDPWDTIGQLMHRIVPLG